MLVDVRVGEHERFDRIVLEFSGAGAPGWTTRYVDHGVQEGSGDVVDLDGDAVLEVFASGTTWPAPDYYGGPGRIRTSGHDGQVDEVYVGGTFEGYTQVLAGTRGRVPVRVLTLTGPPRLVVDVMDEDA